MSDQYNQYYSNHSSPAPGGNYYHQGPQYQQTGYTSEQQVSRTSYGPPEKGGYQHGQGGAADYYNDAKHSNTYDVRTPSGQYPQQGPYGQQPSYSGHNPNHGQSTERGWKGATAGATAGFFGGKHLPGHHKFLGAIAGGFLGSKLEDSHKKKKRVGKANKFGGW
ncbi:hypothetical protein EJ05DRAFT_6097 [Pseudovirgaria hyperparasitica]|uniref:Glycine zipper 2TM domain-containing protein n=1 Tax=Pseudovirgaria hyperparasitica TaxID=470096 RepID=A0A6A6WK77_9PEZI|nr:uncharacterized protein EJ05DRAFT_6097 [Pseudovirgaria hyperparasitica]KAF2762566.1 hypothetical protein EJ05DRAFT_6097 [Pseudovirgaria hyperparasitica]